MPLLEVRHGIHMPLISYSAKALDWRAFSYPSQVFEFIFEFLKAHRMDVLDKPYLHFLCALF